MLENAGLNNVQFSLIETESLVINIKLTLTNRVSPNRPRQNVSVRIEVCRLQIVFSG